MAARTPIVQISGILQELPVGDVIAGAPAGPTGAAGADGIGAPITLTNDNAAAAVIGSPVYSSSADGFDLAKADASSTHKVIGLVHDTTIASAASGKVAIDGTLEATTAQWDVVTGDVGGLTFGATYYLDPTTEGKLTTTAPTTTGQFIKPVGIALSTTVLEILNQPSILL